MKNGVPEEVAARYAQFAREEVGGRSIVYADWSAGIAADQSAQRILARIPEGHRQPPLVFAVARMLGAPVGPYAPFSEWLLAHADALVAEASQRSVQTNEPLRCAALLPALAGIEGPLALIELGASAGLCLYPDRYSYVFENRGTTVHLDPEAGASDVVLHAAVEGRDPATLAMPEIVWRAGIDTAPLDAREESDVAFLTGLAWPGEEGRAERIGAAARVVVADPPLLLRGDATDPAVLGRVLDRVPARARPVVMTPGLLPHLDRRGRERILLTLRALDVDWISLEPAWVRGGAGAEGFVLLRGDDVLARCDPLGGWWEWLAPRSVFPG